MTTSNNLSGTADTVIQAGSIRELHYHQRVEAPPVPRQLPRTVHAFVNQTDALASLDASRQDGRNIVVLSGMGGVGKTALGIHWLTQHADHFPDGTLYAYLGGDSGILPADPADVAAAMLRGFGLAPDRIPEALHARAGLLRSVLSGRRVAMLLDGAVSSEQVLPLLPEEPGCLVVVTSTRFMVGLTPYAPTFVDLRPWSHEGSLALLESGISPSTRPLEPAAARAVAEACGGLPLAITIAAARIAELTRQGRTVERFLAQLTDESRRLPALAIEAHSLTAVIDAAYRDLPPLAARLYRAMGQLPLPHLTPAIGAAALGTSAEEIDEAIDALAAAHLIEARAPDRYGLHDLIKLHAKTQKEEMVSYTDQLRGVMGQALAVLEEIEKVLTPSHFGSLACPRAAEFGAPLRPRIETEAEALAWLEVYRDYVPELIYECATRTAEDPGLHGYVVEGAYKLWPGFLRLSIQRLPLLDLALRSARTIDDEWGELATAMMQNGRVGPLTNAGRFEEALAAAEECGEIWKKRRLVRLQGQAASARGKLRHAMGQYDLAVEDHTLALRLRRQAGYLRGQGLSETDIGWALLELGRYEEALGRFDRSASILLDQMPELGGRPDLYDGAIAWIGKARALGALHRHGEAIELLARADASMTARGSDRGRGYAAEAAGRVLEANGDPLGAAERYLTAVELLDTADPKALGRVSERLAALKKSSAEPGSVDRAAP